MKYRALIWAIAIYSFPIFAANENEPLQNQLMRLLQQSHVLQIQLEQLQQKLAKEHGVSKTIKPKHTKSVNTHEHIGHEQASSNREVPQPFHSAPLVVHSPDAHPESLEFNPTALVADNQVVTYIAGMPVVSSPYLGDRPAFDGSDYIVNISSINRDVRLMQQRRRLYRAYERLGYPVPNLPIIALSGKVEPIGVITSPYLGKNSSDWNLGSSELDASASLNDRVQAYMSFAYDDSPPVYGGPRITNARLFLNMGFINIGNLDESPYYFTAGQLFVPFGRFASAMISAPLTMRLARTRSRPFILGYKSQQDTGPFAALYAFKSDTNLNSSAVGGVNLGYNFAHNDLSGEVGIGVISSLADSSGMQLTGSIPFTTFGGFGSPTNGSELIGKVPGVDVHGNLGFGRYNVSAEWVGATERFRPQDLSVNGKGARPQAAQVEVGATFMAFDKPSSVGFGYQWSKDTLALHLPEQRISGVFNISIWRNTVESLEFRHDIDFDCNQFANGAAPVGVINANTLGTGKSSNTLLAQIGVYF